MELAKRKLNLHTIIIMVKELQIYQPFEGVVNNFERRYNNTDSSFVREELNKYLSKQICDACNGTTM